MADEHKPNPRLWPRVEFEDLAPYYVDSDIPHVLARVRLIDTFLELIADREDLPEETRDYLDATFTDALNYSLAPYAVDIARSVIMLEDSVDAADDARNKKRK